MGFKMADVVAVQTIFAGTDKVTIHLTNISDGTGESAVKKLDISTLKCANGRAPTKLSLWEVEGLCAVMTVKIYSNFGTTPLTWSVLGGTPIHICYANVGGLVDTGTGTGDGSVLLTTTGHTSAARYDLKLTFRMIP